jgi:DNA polymerase
VYIHEERLKQGILTLERVVLACIDRLPWVVNGSPAASPKAIAQACRDAGLPPPPIKAHDADAAEAWEDEHGHLTPWLKALKDLRKAKKMLATLKTMQQRRREDGTMGFSLKYFGAHTGRWAGEAGLNFQNFNRMPMFVDTQHRLIDDPKEFAKHFAVFKDNPDAVEVPVIDVRGLIVAPPGKQIASVDLSQIEPRVLNYLVGNEALLQSIRDGFPIYEAHARSSMGWKGGKLKKENEKLYSLAKARVLGLGYGCGWQKFITVAQLMAGIDITEGDREAALEASMDGTIYERDEKGEPCEPFVYTKDARGGRVKMSVYGANSRAVVADFRKANPLVTGLWRSLQAALEESVGKDLELELPSGRKLSYRAVTVEKKTVTDPETGKPYQKTVLKASVDGIRTTFYGGLLAENLVQAVSRDAFSVNMLALDRAGIRVLWSVHDEAVCLVSGPEEAEKARRIMATTPEWLAGCPVDAEVSISDRFKK